MSYRLEKLSSNFYNVNKDYNTVGNITKAVGSLWALEMHDNNIVVNGRNYNSLATLRKYLAL